jgi:hypothetical protein
MPEVLPAEILAQQLNGTSIWINYPHYVEAFVTAVSDSQMIIRGRNSKPKLWSGRELVKRKKRMTNIVDQFVFGEKLVGTGGLTLVGGQEAMDGLEILLYVRPFGGLKTMSDGTVVKTFAEYEIEVPLFVTGWAPQKLDERLANLLVRLEKDPYNAAKFILQDKRNVESLARKRLKIGNAQEVLAAPSPLPAIAAQGFHSRAMPSNQTTECFDQDTWKAGLAASLNRKSSSDASSHIGSGGSRRNFASMAGAVNKRQHSLGNERQHLLENILAQRRIQTFTKKTYQRHLPHRFVSLNAKN